MFYLENTPGRTCKIKGKEFLFFSGYSYLGMNYLKEFTDFVKEGMDKYGILFPSSRVSNTRLKLYEKFENQLSLITGMEDTVSFSSGYLAGKTISEILSSYKNILVAPNTHPAINIQPTQTIDSLNFIDWKNKVLNLINASHETGYILISDSVNILEAQVNDFSFLENIHPSKKIIFLIDDSHGIGILGSTGSGIISQLPKKNNIEYILSYSLSKAFNIEGGAVSCSKILTETLRRHQNYTASTAINPALAYAFTKSKKLFLLQKEKLFKNVSYLQKHLPALIISSSSGLPIFLCKNENAESIYYKNGIIISSFAYPNPSSKKINRIVINALHTKKDLQQLYRAS